MQGHRDETVDVEIPERDLAREQPSEREAEIASAAVFERLEMMRQRRRVDERGVDQIDLPVGRDCRAGMTGLRHGAALAGRRDAREVALAVGAESFGGFQPAARTGLRGDSPHECVQRFEHRRLTVGNRLLHS